MQRSFWFLPMYKHTTILAFSDNHIYDLESTVFVRFTILMNITFNFFAFLQPWVLEKDNCTCNERDVKIIPKIICIISYKFVIVSTFFLALEFLFSRFFFQIVPNNQNSKTTNPKSGENTIEIFQSEKVKNLKE